MRAQLIRKWNSLPKEAGSSTMEAFFCQWLYWIPLQGHWAILKAISSIAPPHLLPLSLLSSRSHGVICATVSFDPLLHPHPHPFVPNAVFTILHIDYLRWNRHLLCMLGLFNDSREGTESRVVHHLAHNWPTVSVVNFTLRLTVPDLRHSCMNTLKFALIVRVPHTNRKWRSNETMPN